MDRMKIISQAPTDLIEPIIGRKRFKSEEKATLLNNLTIRGHPYHSLKANGIGTVTSRVQTIRSFWGCGLYHGRLWTRISYKISIPWGCHSHNGRLILLQVTEGDITEEDLGDMACYIYKCSNDKLGINHKNRVVQDVSERIWKFEKLSSNSRTSAIWATYHGFICLIKDFIRAERLHDFDLHLVAKMLLIFAVAGLGQYSKA